MSTASALLIQSILRTPTVLPRLQSIRIGQRSGKPDTTIASFMRIRLPIIKYHNEGLKVQIQKVKRQTEKVVGVEVTVAGNSYLLDHNRSSDDEMFEQIIALNKGVVPDGVVQGKLLGAEDQPEGADATQQQQQPTAAAQ